MSEHMTTDQDSQVSTEPTAAEAAAARDRAIEEAARAYLGRDAAAAAQAEEPAEAAPAASAAAPGDETASEGMLTSGLAGELDQETEDLLEALRDVVDPELGVNVVDLGLIYGVAVSEDKIATIDMTLTSAACPLTDVIEDQTRDALEGLVSDFRINWVWMPPWGPDKITDDGREQLRALGFSV
jgi:metal-sulfur cluster biosynthetic enzyme